MAMSAGASQQYVRLASEAGYRQYVSKPFAIEQLDLMISRALHHGEDAIETK
jgi:DNA-binding NtrC family response regulator